MKSRCVLAASVALVAMAQPAPARANGAGLGIVHSAHDFTDEFIENDDSNLSAWNNKRKEICRVCHVPHDHGEVRYGNQGILWNHALTTKTSWQMYASDPSMLDFIDGTVEAAPAGTSKMCLGCHDGVSALNQYDGKTPADSGYGNGTIYTMDDINLGFVVGNTSASLTNNHPISITYDQVGDPGLFDPASATMNNGDTVASLLVLGRVECTTCHDVHDKEAVANTHLLRESTKGANITGSNASQLCIVCHDK